MPRISLSTWSLFLRMDYLQAMRFAIDNGFQGIEIWSSNSYFWPRTVAPDEIAAIRSMCDENNIPLAVHYCTGANNLADINDGHLQESRNQLKETIFLCEEIGAGTVTIHPGMVPDLISHSEPHLDPRFTKEALRREAIERFRESLLEAADFALDHGVVIGLENFSQVKGCIQSRYKDLIQWVDTVNLPSLQITLDVGHANLEEGVPKAFETFGHRIRHIHLNDNDGVSSNHGELGTGTIDWKAMAPFLRRFDGMLSLEVLVRKDLEGAILRSKAFVEKLLSED